MALALPLTLTSYVARRFAVMTLAMLLALTGLVSLFDFIELLRRAATRANAGFAIVAEIAALRLPFVALQILPFAILLGGIVAFWRLTRSSELIVARAAGVSAWGFLAGPLAVALALGLAGPLALSPLSSAMLARAERLDGQYLRNVSGLTAIAGGRLWVRQSDRVLDPLGVAILSGRPSVAREAPGAPLQLADVSIWRLGADDRPTARIEAPAATLEDGRWSLPDALVFGAGRAAPQRQPVLLPTELTPRRIEDSFAPPDTLSFWALPEFIGLLEDAGFSAVRHRLHLHSLMSLPVLALAMALLAAGFSMRHTRRGGVARMIALGVAAGFGLFLLDRITAEFGEAGTLPVPLAAWAPAVAGLLLALTLLLHQEDG